MADFNELNDKLNETVTELANTKDTTPEYDPQDIQANKGMAVLAYLGILVLIPLLGAKESKFARFHVNQGLILAVIEIIIWVAVRALGWIPVVGWILRIARWIISVICLILAIIGIMNAAKGEAKELPFIGGIWILR